MSIKYTFSIYLIVIIILHICNNNAYCGVQASATLNIPREHYRFILGAKGKKLSELELKSATKIHIPRQEDSSQEIKIIGNKEGIDKATHEIQLISDQQVRNSSFVLIGR